MPFPVVFTSSAPAGGRPSADFSGPVLLGKLSDAGPVGTGPQPQPSGSLYVQSTGGQSNQLLSTASITKFSLPYVPVSTGTLVGSATAPPFTGFGAGMVFVNPGSSGHLEVWSSAGADWVSLAPPASGSGVTGGGTANLLPLWTSTGVLGNSVLRQATSGTNIITVATSASIVLSIKSGAAAASGGNLSFIAASAVPGSAGTGGGVSITGGDGSTGATGGTITISAGDGAQGGGITLLSGESTAADGGDINLTAGDASGAGGDIILSAGNSNGSQPGGNIGLFVGSGSTGKGNISIDANLGANADIFMSTFGIEFNQAKMFTYNLPTTNPVIAGALWISTTSRFLTVSSG